MPPRVAQNDSEKCVHLVARALRGLRPLEPPNVAWAFWLRLRCAFPDAVAACLMPNHVHLLTPAEDVDAARLRLGNVLSGLTRSLKQRRLWEPLPKVEFLPDQRHLLRTIRYIHLNPCRDGLTKDPLAWPWSTHRGAAGSEVNPWVSADRLFRIFPTAPKSRKRVDFVRWFHKYVSADPDCSVEGSAFPTSAAPCEWPSRALADVLSAAIAATPWSGRRGVRRHVAVLLARAQGWTHTVDLARALEISPQMVRRWASRADTKLIAPAMMCLGDPRLRLRREHELALAQRKGGQGLSFRNFSGAL